MKTNLYNYQLLITNHYRFTRHVVVTSPTMVRYNLYIMTLFLMPITMLKYTFSKMDCHVTSFLAMTENINKTSSSRGGCKPDVAIHKNKLFVAIGIIIALICFDTTAKTNLPIPRFASSRSSEINVRVGPGPNYPVVWRIIKPGIPLEITAEFDTWRRIRDWDGMSGWVHQSMLSGSRYAIVSNKNGVILNKSNNPESKRIAKLLYNARLSIKKCKEDWCLLRHDGIEGWARTHDLWGVYKDEKVG